MAIVAAPMTTAPHAVAARSTTYTVRHGDTLDAIARAHRTTVARLAAANRIANPHLIQIGQKLTIPGTGVAGSSAKPTAAPDRRHTPRTTYVVRAGDTLSHIAARHRVSLAALLKANRLTARTIIHPGQRLVIERGTPSAAKPAPSKRPSVVPDTFNGVRYPQAVAQSAARNRALLAGMKVPNRSQIKALIVETARRHGVDPRLALAVAYQESGWDHRQVSVANAIGVMQVIPIGGQWASELVGRKLNLLDPRDNVTAGVVMLRALSRSTTSTEQAIGAYYQGLHSVKTKGLYRETQRYVANVLALRARM
ncbi:MAG: LysM peptidoglycan-binding domain-containing protein [Tetrasphaera sp.]|nr:LysM peptidoglycan-binding domain-containing protein [Tetrasphaera sp.]